MSQGVTHQGAVLVFKCFTINIYPTADCDKTYYDVGCAPTAACDSQCADLMLLAHSVLFSLIPTLCGA